MAGRGKPDRRHFSYGLQNLNVVGVQQKEINIILKFAEIDNKPYSADHEGWVSCLVNLLQQTLEYYFDCPVRVHLRKETEAISEQEFQAFGAVIYVLSPAFLLASNIAADLASIEKAFLFDTEFINGKIHKVLKGPVKKDELPVIISIGTFHYFYQTGSTADSTYETLFDWDNSAIIRNRYWESFSNLLFDLLKSLKHPKHERFIPQNNQTFFLGSGDIGQLWNRTNLLGELSARGIRILPDHDHSIEVKHLNDPVKFYLKKSDLAIHFPEEFIPLEKKVLEGLADLPWLKRYIWFNPDAEKDPAKRKQYDELQQKLKNLDHIEAVSSGLEELKEIIFSERKMEKNGEDREDTSALPGLYLIVPDKIEEAFNTKIQHALSRHPVKLLFLNREKVQEKRIQHYRNLKESDYCLICYDGKEPEWLRANINEVKKSSGLNPDKSQKIKLGILIGTSQIPVELQEYQHSLPLISAMSLSFEEEVNDYIHE